MKQMIDLSSQRGPIRVIDMSTAIDCGKDIRCWRSFRSLVDYIVPCCGFQSFSYSSSDENASTLGSTVTGTFFGYRKGRVSFCLQDNSRSSPLLLLEFAVPTSYLAREMQYGLLRIRLECNRLETRSTGGSLFSVPVWAMYYNGRKVGFAVRRQTTESDVSVLKLMRTVSIGAGVLPTIDPRSEEGDLMYMRATFERVVGSADSESFHMKNPVGSSGQELSIFFLRT